MFFHGLFDKRLQTDHGKDRRNYGSRRACSYSLCNYFNNTPTVHSVYKTNIVTMSKDEQFKKNLHHRSTIKYYNTSIAKHNLPAFAPYLFGFAAFSSPQLEHRRNRCRPSLRRGCTFQ